MGSLKTVKTQMKCSISSGSNSEDPDEMPHMAAFHQGQTVKTQMKCRIMRHFIRVCTVCQDKNNLQGQKYIIL